MDFSSGRLIAAGEGLNVWRSVDGVRVICRRGPWLINGQLDKLVSIKRGLFNDGPDWSQIFWGRRRLAWLRLGRPSQRDGSCCRNHPRTVSVIHDAFDPLADHVEPDG
jgi:hypothetical protein